MQTGTYFAYYHICKRKLWLFAKGITMEHSSDLVADGKLIHEESYQNRSEKYQEVSIDGIKVDYYDTKNKIIHEIKRSNKIEHAHEWQLKYYIYMFERNGVNGVEGILEYPTLRKTKKIQLSEQDRDKILEIEKDIEEIIDAEKCPELKLKGACKNCSYFDFCFCTEEI